MAGDPYGDKPPKEEEDPPPQNDDPPSDSPPPAPSAPAAPPVDPIAQRRIAMFQSIYTQLWGEPATEAYLKSAANSGMNSWEFAEQERKKPAFSQTGTYKAKAQSLADMLRGWGVA